MNSSVSGKKFGWSNEVKAFRVKCEEVCMCLKCVFESLLSAAALTNTTELKISRYVCERVLMQAVRGCNVVGVSGAWVSHVSVHRRQFDTSASPPERNSQQLSGSGPAGDGRRWRAVTARKLSSHGSVSEQGTEKVCVVVGVQLRVCRASVLLIGETVRANVPSTVGSWLQFDSITAHTFYARNNALFYLFNLNYVLVYSRNSQLEQEVVRSCVCLKESEREKRCSRVTCRSARAVTGFLCNKSRRVTK